MTARIKNVLTVDENLTVNLQRRRQLAVCSRCLEPQPQKLGCRLLTVSLAVVRGGWCWYSGVVVGLANRRRGSADQGSVVRRADTYRLLSRIRSRSLPKFNQLFSRPQSTYSPNFMKIHVYSLVILSSKQTNRKTCASWKNTPAMDGQVANART